MATIGVLSTPSYRSDNAFGFLICAVALVTAELYLEPLADLQNCLLCAVIRLLLVAMAGLFLAGFIINRFIFLQRLIALTNMVLVCTGLVTLIRHLFSTGTSSTSCNMTSSDLLDIQSPDQIIVALNSAVSCPKLGWNIYDFGVAHMSLILFAILFVVIWQILTKKQQKKTFF